MIQVLLAPFYRSENYGSEKINTLAKIQADTTHPG